MNHSTSWHAHGTLYVGVVAGGDADMAIRESKTLANLFRE